MTPEFLNAMSIGIFNLLMMMAQTIALIIGLATIAGFAIYLISIAWLCFLETRRGSAPPKTLPSAPESPEPDEHDLLVNHSLQIN